MRDLRNEYKIFIVKLKRRDHVRDIGIGGGIILKWIFEMNNAKMYLVPYILLFSVVITPWFIIPLITDKDLQTST
jgi:hypothetical protein